MAANRTERGAAVNMPIFTPPPLCLHCKRNKGVMARGLCASCYNTREGVVRRLYGARRKTRRNEVTTSVPDHVMFVGRPIAPTPTRYLPGTEGKIQVMVWRHSNGYRLWHPDDAR